MDSLGNGGFMYPNYIPYDDLECAGREEPYFKARAGSAQF